ncbi:hypothetical protein N0V90_009121 [Kalmusia sp. IMI 367209]|nr:hypothetical protein N0V90_009121 [Kalmusia sp. IMI 367209]
MANSTKVAILGATGESAGLILNGLLDSKEQHFVSKSYRFQTLRFTETQLTALARFSSADKPEYARLSQKGVKIAAVDLNGPEEKLVETLQGIDVLIASVPPTVLDVQLPLIRAAKQAGVKRFLPSAYSMVIALGGVSTVQEKKEQIYAELERIGLPYTIIDVGWWHFGFIPRLPSGRTDYAIALPDFLINMIPGDGNMRTCLVDNQDVGPLIARIIADHRTLNKRIIANGDALTMNELYDIVEKVTDEKPERKYVSTEQLGVMIRDITARIEGGMNDYRTMVGKFWLEYLYSSFITGDNSPEAAQRLGYEKALDLYPDFKPVKFEEFFRDIIRGGRRIPYSRD